MPERHAGRTWVSLAALAMVLVASCALSPYRATDGTLYPRASIGACGLGIDDTLEELKAPLLASAAHDLPCAPEQLHLVSTCSPRCCKGAILIVEGCGERVSYAQVNGDDAAQLTLIGRVKVTL